MVMRVWVVSGLIVAAVVAGILVFSDGSRPEIDTPRTQPAAPSPLTEQEVRTYLTVWPQINEVLGVAVKAMGDPGAPGVNKKELGERDEFKSEIEELEEALQSKSMPDEARKSEGIQKLVRGHTRVAEKDLAWALQLARKAGVALPVGSLVSQSMARLYGVEDERRR